KNMRRTSKHQEVVSETVTSVDTKVRTRGEHLNIRRWSQRQSTSVNAKVRHERTSKHQEVVTRQSTSVDTKVRHEENI
ncbi:hypothetical protein WMY93_033480, partial [Mugilogobius chulae]